MAATRSPTWWPCSRAVRRSSPSRRTFRSAARWCSRPAGKPIAPAARRDCAQPVERDLFDCHIGCFWPAHVPDQLNHAPDWTGQVRGGPEGLAQDRPGVPRMRTRHASAYLPPRPRPPSSSPLMPAVVGPDGARRQAGADALAAATARCTSAPTRARSRSTTRPPRSSSTRSPLKTGHPAIAHAVARPDALLRPRTARFEKIEIVDIATRKTIDSFKLSVGNKHVRVNNLAAGSEQQVPDPDVPHRDQAGRPLGDRAADDPAVRPDHAPVHPHDSVAEGRRAREREHAARPRRQAPVHLRRRGDGARDRPTSPRSSRGRSRRRPSRARPDQPRAVARLLRPRRDLHRPLHDGRRGAEAPADGHRPGRPGRRKVDFQPIGPATAGVVRQVARRQARLRTGPGHRPLRDVDLRPREAGGAEAHRVRGPAAHGACASAPTASWSTSTSPAPPSTSGTRQPTSTCARWPLGGDQTTELFVVPGGRGHVHRGAR